MNTPQVFIVWIGPNGTQCELQISHTVSDTVTVAKAWAHKFTVQFGVPHHVEVR